VGLTEAGGEYLNQYSYLPFGESLVRFAAEVIYSKGCC